ncbi:ATP-binding protein [Candidatus Puniceispirillum sp.]|uniref:ATP-binding protein n=1 Tax=Candidatus Puniceispirillum sp. TaxID=2026719 RepID=UPI001EC6B14D|nr:ATP-binding protein [Candidatus Puniceispirillum sp.]MBT6566562.1 ATP-binding protein [Candidatus Puniceispirillum sp.]
MADNDSKFILIEQVIRIADALERMSPPTPKPDDLDYANAYVWHAAMRRLDPVYAINCVRLDLLRGIDQQRDNLLANSIAFGRGLPANNALLWGARGTGKSSLVKAVHASMMGSGLDCALVEIHREDIVDLPFLMSFLAQIPRQFILFCDDLAFDSGETSYKSLKAALEGGIEGRPNNIVFYATSNRRHLMPRQMMENERSTVINPSETTEESVSLSDRFGLWIGFYSIDQDVYLEMIEGYVSHFGINVQNIDVRHEALSWSVGRGARSGRVAWQYIVDLAARTETKLK